LRIFILPKHGSSSIKYNKHNIQQNEQATRKKKLNYTFTQPAEDSKFTFGLCYSFSPQIAWHIEIMKNTGFSDTSIKNCTLSIIFLSTITAAAAAADHNDCIGGGCG